MIATQSAAGGDDFLYPTLALKHFVEVRAPLCDLFFNRIGPVEFNDEINTTG